MAKEFPPFVNATGQLATLFQKIKEAPPPPRFTQDFLTTKLGFAKTGSSFSFIPFLKRIGFLGSDGIPTDIYKTFRNPDPAIAGAAMAKAIKTGFQELYSRNEYWHTLSKDALKNFLIEVTETDPKNATIGSILNTITVLKKLASFEPVEQETDSSSVSENTNQRDHRHTPHLSSSFSKLNLSYTINLNLPETSDITVFDAIFKSLKENILKNED